MAIENGQFNHAPKDLSEGQRESAKVQFADPVDPRWVSAIAEVGVRRFKSDRKLNPLYVYSLANKVRAHNGQLTYRALVEALSADPKDIKEQIEREKKTEADKQERPAAIISRGDVMGITPGFAASSLRL